MAVFVVAVAVSGCGRLADRGGAEPAPVPAASSESRDNSSTLDDVDALLEEADQAVREAEQDAAEGDTAVGTGDEP